LALFKEEINIEEGKMEAPAKVLVVDDEKGICQNVEKILKKKNYEVTTAVSAEEAMEKMGEGAYSMLISDIVMPGGKNGLELLKLVKDQWPLTKVIMMTAYASTDTAVKAIRLGALDYLPKPFTPDELRSTVDQALAGELAEAPVSSQEKELIDVDIPFDPDEVAKVTGEAYAKTLGPSDIPVVEPAPETLKNYCMVGEMVCEIFDKLGNTCKAGVKGKGCPQKKAKMKKSANKVKEFDARKLIGIDQPFNYEEVVSVTGPEYVRQMQYDGIGYVPYEELKGNVARMMAAETGEEAPAAEVTDHREVLVIDDEVSVNNNIRKILSKKGYRVDQAMNKDEALAKINESVYRLILLDLKIPGVQGLELLEAIRERSHETMVIIITGYASIETAVEATRLGAVDYLPKPFTPDEMRKATEEALRLAA
jgi:DNA-binding response OmpR family regulator